MPWDWVNIGLWAEGKGLYIIITTVLSLMGV